MWGIALRAVERADRHFFTKTTKHTNNPTIQSKQAAQFYHRDGSQCKQASDSSESYWLERRDNQIQEEKTGSHYGKTYWTLFLERLLYIDVWVARRIKGHLRLEHIEGRLIQLHSRGQVRHCEGTLNCLEERSLMPHHQAVERDSDGLKQIPLFGSEAHPLIAKESQPYPFGGSKPPMCVSRAVLGKSRMPTAARGTQHQR